MHGVVSGFLSLYAGSLLTGGVSIGLCFQLCMFFSILLAPKISCKSCQVPCLSDEFSPRIFWQYFLFMGAWNLNSQSLNFKTQSLSKGIIAIFVSLTKEN